MKKRSPAGGYFFLVLPLLLAMLVLFIFPIARILARSLFDPGLTLVHYTRAVSDSVYLRVLGTTLEISLLTTLVCLLFGYPLAYIMAAAKPRYRGLLMGVVALSLVMSLLVKNYSWTILLQDTGVINTGLMRLGLISKPLPLMYNLFGVLVGMVQMLLPFMVLPIYSVLNGLDRTLTQASRVLGAGTARTFWHVTLPLSLPGIGAGSLLVFIISTGFFITPALLGGRKEMMLANLIDNQVRVALNWPFASTLAILLLALTLASYLVYHRFFGTERLWERV
jgi:putative spermidine/putrescine transport system permease protein